MAAKNSRKSHTKPAKKPELSRSPVKIGRPNKELTDRVRWLENCVVMCLLHKGEGSPIDMCDKEKYSSFEALRTRLTDPTKRALLLQKIKQKTDAVGKPERPLTEQEKMLAGLREDLAKREEKENKQAMVMEALMKQEKKCQS